MDAPLRIRILMADPTLRVADIIDQDIVRRMPSMLAQPFLAMRIAWIDSRDWGRAFKLGDEVLHLGHRKGDHIASRPWVHGLDEAAAEEFLRRQIEGTALHELGHAVLSAFVTRFPASQAGFMAAFREAVEADGPPSSYFGHDPNVTWSDALHEVFAESFRYFYPDTAFRTMHERVWTCVAYVLEQLMG